MPRIVVVGAGFSGTLVAVHLLRAEAPDGSEVVLFERGARFGPGVAYATPRPEHLLNVPACRMSAFEEDASHFLDWLRARGAAATEASFVPRALYGDYLAELLDETERKAARRDVRLVRRADEVIGFTPAGDRFRVSTRSAADVDADGVVLAIGALPRARQNGGEAFRRWLHDPWAGDALAIPADAPVVLVGSGLTMLDLAVALDETGHRAPIHVLSRRGLLPHPHREGQGGAPARKAPAGLDRWPCSALGQLRALRREAALAAACGVDWREVVTSLRGDTDALWSRLPLREQRRFLEHLRPFWDVHRHRSAPATWARAESLRRDGRLACRAGRIADVRPEEGALRVELTLRGGRPLAIRAARVYDCRGPATAVAGCRDPLVRDLVALGLARPEPLGLGFDTDEHGALIGGDGRAQPRLLLAGPLRRGRVFEHTAVPELRREAPRIAARIARAALP